MNNNNLPKLIENNQLNKIRKDFFIPYLMQDNIIVCTYFNMWCIVVLNDDYEITAKYWGKKQLILKCFIDFIENDILDLNILGVAKVKSNDTNLFKMDINMRNCWYD